MVETKTGGQEFIANPPSDSEVSVRSLSSSSDVSTQDVVLKPDTPKAPPRRSLWRRLSTRFRKDPIDPFFEGLIYESADAYPEGYPRLAAFQNSDPRFRVYKRFGTLRNRVILHRQQELAVLEDELRKLDEDDSKDDIKKYRNLSLAYDKASAESKRTELIDQIDNKLKQYDDILERERRSGRMQKPSQREYRNLATYIWNEKPVLHTETQFLKFRDDFVQLSDIPESPLENVIDYIICNLIPTRWLRNQFSSEQQMSKTSDKSTTIPSPRKVVVFARLVAIGWAILLIGVPLSVLASEVFTESTKLIVLMVSLLAFPVAIHIAARPRTLELFVATATYCAVLTTLLATSSTFSLSELRSQLNFSMASTTAST